LDVIRELADSRGDATHLTVETDSDVGRQVGCEAAVGCASDSRVRVGNETACRSEIADNLSRRRGCSGRRCLEAQGATGDVDRESDSSEAADCVREANVEREGADREGKTAQDGTALVDVERTRHYTAGLDIPVRGNTASGIEIEGIVLT
jgi:hypothetical protein